MAAPGVGAIVALIFRATVDDPARIRSSKSIGPCFGLTPRKYQSGEIDRNGGRRCRRSGGQGPPVGRPARERWDALAINAVFEIGTLNPSDRIM